MIVPDSIEPVAGYRVWGTVPTGRDELLQSITSEFLSSMPIWPTFERFEARCLAYERCDGDVPTEHHSCGIHAFKELDDAMSWARSMAKIRPVVVGETYLWGRVVETLGGYRAQFAYPRQIQEAVFGGRVRRSPDLLEISFTYGLQIPSACA